MSGRVGAGGIEDRRGSGFGGGLRSPIGATGGGLGLIAVLLAILFGGGVLGGGDGGDPNACDTFSGDV